MSWLVFTGEVDISCVALAICLTGALISVAIFALRRLRAKHNSERIARRVSPTLAMTSIAACVGLTCGLACWSNWSRDVELLPSLLEEGQTIEVALTGDPAERDYGFVSTGSVDADGHAIYVRLIWPDDVERASAGHTVAVTGKVLSPQANEAGRWSHQNGLAGSIKAESVDELGHSESLQGTVAGFRDDSFVVLERLTGDSSGLLSGILLGNKTLYAGTELELAFQTTGLAHLMAVSGTHLAIVTALISLLLRKLPLKRICRAALLIAAIGSYVALTGFASSALRAFVMCGVASTIGILERRPDIVSSLALCVFVFLGLTPTMAFSIGFQLSVLAVFGLVMFGDLASSWIQRLVPPLPEFACSSIGATLAATVTTLPVTISLFAQLPIISPIANLIVAPLVSVALCVGMLGIVANAIIAPIGGGLLAVSDAIANLSAKLVHALADIPGACLPVSSGSSIVAVAFAILLVALWIAWPQPTSDAEGHEGTRLGKFAARCVAIACFLSLPLMLAIFLGFGRFQLAQPTSSSQLVVLDVGQGDSILMRSGDSAVLVDTGERTEVLVQELAEKSVSHLDAIFITHKDADHAGALKKLAGIVGVDHVYVHEDLLGKEVAREVLESASWVTSGKGAEGVSPGFKARFGEFELSVIAPTCGGNSENDDSLVILVEYDAEGDGTVESRGILTGDAEKDAMRDVVAVVGDVDFLKVAHHGSKGGLNDEQLEALSPEIALISVGAQNKYGHPAQETLQMLSDAHARTYRTDEQGAVSVFFTKQGMAIETER